MDIEKAKTLIHMLQTKGIIFEEGISDKEYDDIAQLFSINFPPDLKLFLQIALTALKLGGTR
jgi:hypothetical protein